ncbi:hypothetical protein [Demequina oxidasica]|uniref:hypothetical protein n=1 Tax=Demequina oxidasica TaxID=676199 RepID=UPI000783F813|nr:hypothetical protein [Demequina oxidasica]
MTERTLRHDGSSKPADLVSTPTDVSDLLSLKSAPARFILYLFILSNVVFTLATLDRMQSAWPSFVGLVLISAGALIVTRPHADPLPWLDTVAIVAIVCVTALVMNWHFPQADGLGRESWNLGAATWLLFFLALRRRARIAWLGIALLTAITIWWAVSVGHSPLFGLTLMQNHWGILLVATLFASSLRRTARIINTLTNRSVDAAAAAAAADASLEIRRQRVSELAALAVPHLERIAIGAPLTDEDRRVFQTVEAELRDSVRGRSLTLPTIADAARDARSRGVTVNLLDDRGAPLPSGDAMRRLGRVVVNELERAQHGTVTARMLPEGRDTAVTVVSGEGEDRQRVSLDDAGERIVG